MGLSLKPYNLGTNLYLQLLNLFLGDLFDVFALSGVIRANLFARIA